MKYQRLPREIDPYRLVEQGRELVGRLPVTDFSRLQDMLFYKTADDRKRDKTALNVTLVFDRTETGLPMVKGKIECDLDLHCQRCLKAVNMPFETDLAVVFVTTDVQAETLQEGFDTWLVEDNNLFLQDFIEDEILLALPIVVSHEKCQPARELIEALPEDAVADGSEDKQEKENPFAALKDLKLK
ncbi:MAG TPA: hypothetical protein EYH16_05770 [Leucothrix mucor]|nr:hypothetical protein [Leucothrix mucor]